MPAVALTSNDLWFLDNLVRIHVSRENAGLSVLELSGRLGDSPPLHIHRTEDEIFHVIEGELTLRVGDDEFSAGSGETLNAPKGIPHTYRVESETACWLAVTPNGDFERFVREFSRPAERSDLPDPSGPPSLEAQQALGAAAAAHGIDLVGPPLS